MALTINAKLTDIYIYIYKNNNISYHNIICWKVDKTLSAMDNPWLFIIITTILLALYVWSRRKRQQINTENIQRLVGKVRFHSSIYVHSWNKMKI